MTQALPRRDPSLALLESLIVDALDPGYGEAARRRTPEAARRARRSPAGRAGTAVSLLAVSVVLTVAIQEVRASAPAVAQRRQVLINRVNSTGRTINALERQVTATTEEVDKLRTQALGGAGSASTNAGLAALGAFDGLIAVVGPGVSVTVDDAPQPSAGSGDDLSRVLDVDLQDLVNGLWRAGAEAIDINGHRLTSLSAIRGAGDAILVDYRPLARPYVVTAIGDSGLGRRFASGPAGVELRGLKSDYGMRYDVSVKEHVEIPAATAVTLRAVNGAG